MTTPPVHRPRARRSSGLRRLAALGVAGAFLLFAAGCTQSGQPDASTDTGPTVLGVFEFEFGGFESGEVTASVRRIDVEDGIGSSALGTSPVGGISVTASSIGSGATTCGAADYLFSVYDVTTPSSLTGVTFIGYASQGFSLEGSAFAEVSDLALNRIAGASTITPSIGGALDCVGGVPALTNAGDLATVAYGTSEFAALESALTTNFSFVETAFPYGFVASNGDSRTLDTAGQLKLGFRVPTGVELVRWRAVAVIDGAHRLALPVEFNSRDAGGTDNLAAFADRVGTISKSNGAPVEAVVLGSMPTGEDRALALNADAFTLPVGGAQDVELPWLVLADARVAGWSGGPAASYWVTGTETPNAATTPFELTVAFTSVGTDYTFTPTQNLTVDYLVVGGGGGGGSRRAETGGGGAGGLLQGPASLTPQAYPIVVGAGGPGGGSGDPAPGANGEASSGFGVTALGGGGGGAVTGRVDISIDGADGGSGGGAGAEVGAETVYLETGTAGSGTVGQGNAGATSVSGTGGRGGGAGSSGADGGLGVEVFGTTYAAGGPGGLRASTATAVAGAANTGNGGGGANGPHETLAAGGNGGSGIVVVRYELPQP